MGIPKSVVKIRKNGVEYTSSVDAVQYTIRELTRAALRDIAKLLRKRIIAKLKKLPGMKRHRRIYRSSQYWIRKRETDLVIGFKHDAWYGVDQELGDSNQPRRGILRETVDENIDEIIKIQSQYLSGISAEKPDTSKIDESEVKSDDKGD